MITLNLLSDHTSRVEGPVWRGSRAPAFVGCGLTAAALALAVWWYASYSQRSAAIAHELTRAREDAARAAALRAEGDEIARARGLLERRLLVVEEWQTARRGARDALERIGRATPPDVWLTYVEWTVAGVTIEGHAASHEAASALGAALGPDVQVQAMAEPVGDDAYAYAATMPEPPAEGPVRFSIAVDELRDDAASDGIVTSAPRTAPGPPDRVARGTTARAEEAVP